MPRITLTGYIVVPDSDLQSVLKELPRHIELTRQEPGCLAFDVRQRESSLNEFEVYEEFVSRDAFEEHQTRVKKSTWGVITARVTRHYSIQELNSQGILNNQNE